MIRTLYKLLSIAGDAKSLSRSPGAYARRKVRAKGHKALSRAMRRNKWLRP